MPLGDRSSTYLRDEKQSSLVQSSTTVLILPMLDGEAKPGEAYEILNVKNEGSRLFGGGSTMQIAVDTFKSLNKETKLKAVGLLDTDSGKASSCSIKLTGIATKAGNLKFVFGSARVEYEIAFGEDEKAVDIANKMIGMVNAEEKSLVKAILINSTEDNPSAETFSTETTNAGADNLSNEGDVNVSGTSENANVNDGNDILTRSTEKADESVEIKIEAKNKGDWFNNAPIWFSDYIPGVEIEITAFKGGGGNPSIKGILEKFANEKIDIVCINGHYNDIAEYLEKNKFNTYASQVAGIVFSSMTEEYSKVINPNTTKIAKYKGVFTIHRLRNEDLSKGNGLFMNTNVEFDTSVIALRALKHNQGSSISSFYYKSDYGNIGGLQQRKRPYTDMVMLGLKAFPDALKYLFLGEQQAELETLGFNHISVSETGEQIILKRVNMTSAPASDLYKHLNDFDVLDAVRMIFDTRVKMYGRDKYSGSANQTNVGTLSESFLKAELLSCYVDLANQDTDFNLLSNDDNDQEYFANSVRIKQVKTEQGKKVFSEFAIKHNGQIAEFTTDIYPELI